VLLISAELCSVTFQWNDLSKRNLIAASLFADGAAAVLGPGFSCELALIRG
jgi:alkylresorcinol/alkylpyrone synthase